MQIELYHAIDPQHSDNYVNRGNITVSNLNSCSFDANQLSLTNEDRIKLKVIYIVFYEDVIGTVFVVCSVLNTETYWFF